MASPTIRTRRGGEYLCPNPKGYLAWYLPGDEPYTPYVDGRQPRPGRRRRCGGITGRRPYCICDERQRFDNRCRRQEPPSYHEYSTGHILPPILQRRDRLVKGRLVTKRRSS